MIVVAPAVTMVIYMLLCSDIPRAVLSQSTVRGQDGCTKYRQHCTAGKRCEYTLTLPECQKDDCQETGDRDHDIILQIVRELSNQIQSLTTEVSLLSSKLDEGAQTKGQTTINLLSENTEVTVVTAVPDLSAFTACVWARINNAVGRQPTLVSYAVPGSANEMTMTYDVHLHIVIKGQILQIETMLGDSSIWYHVCVTWTSNGGVWKSYYNGTLDDEGRHFVSGRIITGGGNLVLGQEQDSVGGNYESHQALLGSLTDFNMWSRALSDDEIVTVMTGQHSGGDVFGWNAAFLQINGDVSITTEKVY
ncbi:neuronal pentraxin-1-like [Ptychodera flava]|uniref:neuronal pentraxin-1-like n=1 Tax=Ptychodera flava TaxID=63121 RepID=UPI00396A999E